MGAVWAVVWSFTFHVIVCGLLCDQLTLLHALPEQAIIEDAPHFIAADVSTHPRKVEMQEIEIREQLAQVLQGQLPLEDFAYWLRRHRNTIYKSATPAAQALAGSIALMLYEYDDGYRNDTELQNGLSQLLSTYRMAAETNPQSQLLPELRHALLPSGSASHVWRYDFASSDPVTLSLEEPSTSLSGMLVSI